MPVRLLFWVVRIPKRIARWLLVKAMVHAIKHSRLKVWTMSWLHNHPKLDAKLRRLAETHGLFPTQAANTISEQSDLTPHARRIYEELKSAMAKYGRERH